MEGFVDDIRWQLFEFEYTLQYQLSFELCIQTQTNHRVTKSMQPIRIVDGHGWILHYITRVIAEIINLDDICIRMWIHL